MDTTTQKGKTLSMRASQRNKKNWLPVLSPLALVLTAHFAHAEGLNVSASVEAKSLLQNRHSNVRNEELLTLAVTPEGRIGYTSRTFRGYVTGSVTQMERDSDDVVRKDTYAEYGYGASWEAIDNLLTLETRGSQRFLDNTGANFLISDYFLYAEELVKVETQSYSAKLTLPQGDYIAGGGSVNYSAGDSSESEFRPTTTFNNDSMTSDFYLMNGNDAQNYFWTATGMYRDLERDEQTSNGDYSGTYLTGSLDSMVYGPIGIRLNASYDANELTDRTDEFSNKRQFRSYGVGLTYRQDAGHYVAITANKVNSDVERDDGDIFVGIDTRWAITPRTSFQATYGRRFYGKSGSAALTYNSRKIRGALRYNEQVTSYSQLVANPQSLGIFVCPIGQFTAADCFQPPSLDYSLGDGEQYLQFIDSGVELSNAVILRKSAAAEMGLQGRRATVLLNLQYADDNFLEFNRQRTIYSATVSGTYELGRRTTLLGSLRYGTTEQDNGTSTADNEQWLLSTGLRRKFGKSLSGDIEAGYMKRTGTLATSVYGANYDERRITLTVRYEYE